MRRTATALLLVAGFTGPAAAQTAADWLELLSPDRILRVFIQSGVVALRTQVGISYEGLTVDAHAGRAAMTDVEIWPAVEWEDGHLCQILIDRVNLIGTPWTALEDWRLKIEASGVTLSPQCLPPEARPQMRMFGLNGLAVPLVTMDATYELGSAETQVLASAFVGGFAVATLDADFSYVSFREGEFDDDMLPVLLLSSARMTIQNRGAWDSARSMLPPPLTDADTGSATLGAMLQGMLADYDSGFDPVAAEAAVADLIASATATWPKFLANPDTLVLETGIPEGESVFLNFDAYEAGPVPLIEAVRPTLALANSRTTSVLPVDLLGVALSEDPSSLSAEDRRRVGLALLTGIGAPRNIAVGASLLSGLAEEGDPDLALVLGEALSGSDPSEAYRWALVASAAKIRGGAALLDRVERNIGQGAALRMQSEAGAGDAVAIVDPAEMRRLAQAYVDGRGVARSYARALYWGLLATAAGDPAARTILDELDVRMENAPAATQALWRDLEMRAREAATETWINGDLPSRLSRED
jgi:hypothetical protein